MRSKACPKAAVPPLSTILAQVPDFRQAQGRRHPLGAILTLASMAMLCGYRSPSAIAEWGRNYDRAWLQLCGFKHGVAPSQSTLHRVFKELDVEALEEQLAQWAEAVIRSFTATSSAIKVRSHPQSNSNSTAKVEVGAEGAKDLPKDLTIRAIAIDGKSLRGSRRRGAKEAHLLSACSQRLGVVLRQVAVADKSNEIVAVEQLLANLVLHGRLITGDAMFTQQEVARTITAAGGDYLLVVKKNQPTLYRDIVDVFATPYLLRETIRVAEDDGVHGGRLEVRELQASTALQGYSDWPSIGQVLCIKRTVTNKKSGKCTRDVAYAVTSLSAERATPDQLLQVWREHWSIENKLHWVRDVTFDEDRQQLREGHAHQVLAALRNTAIGLLRLLGETNIASACRRFAAQPALAASALGLLNRE